MSPAAFGSLFTYGYEFYGPGRSTNDKWAGSDLLSEQHNQTCAGLGQQADETVYFLLLWSTFIALLTAAPYFSLTANCLWCMHCGYVDCRTVSRDLSQKASLFSLSWGKLWVFSSRRRANANSGANILSEFVLDSSPSTELCERPFYFLIHTVNIKAHRRVYYSLDPNIWKKHTKVIL